jgi:type IV secretion system protein VirB11
MNAENLSLDFMKNRLFGDFLAQDGLTEIAVNRPGELHTKIRGKWQKQASPITLRQCHALPERWRPGMTIILTIHHPSFLQH